MASAAVVAPQGWQLKQLSGGKGGRGVYLLVPSTYAAGTASPLLVLLHGAGKGAADALATLSADDLQALRARRCLLLVPESRGGTWDVVATGSFRQDLPVIAAALGQVLGSYSVDRRRIGVEGFSDGATYALSIGLGGPAPFTHVVALSPGGFVPPSGRPGRAPAVFIAHGARDGLFPIAQTGRKAASQLRALLPGGDVRYEEFPGAHEVDPGVQARAIKWFLGEQP